MVGTVETRFFNWNRIPAQKMRHGSVITALVEIGSHLSSLETFCIKAIYFNGNCRHESPFIFPFFHPDYLISKRRCPANLRQHLVSVTDCLRVWPVAGQCAISYTVEFQIVIAGIRTRRKEKFHTVVLIRKSAFISLVSELQAILNETCG